MLSIASFQFTPNSSDITSSQFALTLANAIESGENVSQRIGFYTIASDSQGVTISSGVFSQRVPRSGIPNLTSWLRGIAFEVRRSKLGYISFLAPELQRGILLREPYEEILRICEQVGELSNICGQVSFWQEKARAELGIEAEEFGEDVEDPAARYLELLTRRGEVCYRGSEAYILPSECAWRAGAMNREDLVDYFLSKLPEYQRESTLARVTDAAARAGHEKLVRALIARGVSPASAIPIARYGDRELIGLITGHTSQIPTLVYYTALGGHRYIVRELQALTRENTDEPAFRGYLRGGFVDYAKEIATTSEELAGYLRRPNEILYDLAVDAPVQSLEYIISLGANDIVPAIENTLMRGNIPAFRYLISQPQRVRVDPNYILNKIFISEVFGSIPDKVKSQLPELITEVVATGVTNLNTPLIGASMNSDLSVVKKLIELGATNIGEVIDVLNSLPYDEERKRILEYLRGLQA